MVSVFFWAFKSILGLIVARTAYQLLARLTGVDPGTWLADLILTAPSPETVELLRWIIAGAIALVVLVGYELWRNRRYPSQAPTPSAPVSERPRPNYDAWDERTNFSLLEAAYLWADQEPGGYPLSREAQLCLEKLAAAARDSNLKLAENAARRGSVIDSIQRNRGRNQAPDPTWRITRDALTSFAYGDGEKPPFLFPRERLGSSSEMVWVLDAIRYATHGAWSGGGRQEVETELINEARFIRNLRQEGADGRTVIRGRASHRDGIEQDIPAKYWLSWTIGETELFRDDPRELRTKRVNQNATDPTFHALRMSKGEAERIAAIR